MFFDLKWHDKNIRRLGSRVTTVYTKGYNPVQSVTGGLLKDLEHFRTTDARGRQRHVAVVVLIGGRCFLGDATCSEKDPYSHRYGYRLSVGRALKRAACNCDAPDFIVPGDAEGRDLHRLCAEKVFGGEG